MTFRALLAASLLLAAAAATAGQPRDFRAGRGMTTISYTLVHPLHTVEAVSRDAQFRISADPATRTITAIAARVDVTSFDSGNSNRDSHAMEVVDALRYPEARFTSAAVQTAGDSLTVRGSLEFHGVTSDVVARGASSWDGGGVTLRARFAISMTAFGIERPSLLMVPVEDTLRFYIETHLPIDQAYHQ